MAKIIFKDKGRAKLELWINRFMLLVALAAITSLILEHGRYLSPDKSKYLELIDIWIIIIFVCESLFKLFIARLKRTYLRNNWIDFFVIGTLFIWLIAGVFLSESRVVGAILKKLNLANITALYLRIIQIYIVYHILRAGVKLQKAVAVSSVRPAQILVFSYLSIITLGTVLLYAPRATAAAERISFIDALFTATSATCVTGLIVQDTGSYFSQYGQIVILVLIQIGGLGLMTFTMFFSIIFSGRLGLREVVVLQDVMSYEILSKISRLIILILFLTLVFEVAGACLLYNLWDDPGMAKPTRIYYSVFHAISSFCNAGFSLYKDSFMGYSHNAIFNLVVPLLIIFGGLGFAVHYDILSLIKDKITRKSRGAVAVLAESAPPFRVSLHAKIVLGTTLILLIVGFLLFFTFEYNGALKALPLSDKVTISFFQSVTPRTAGFSTVDFSGLKSPTLFTTMMLMFIGASPGSTGGGIKTVTLAVLIIMVISVIRNRENVEVGKKMIPSASIKQAVVVIVLALGLVSLSCLVLLYIEQAKGFSFLQVAFETVSAFGTVGLSTGITGSLSTLGKVIIIITMFCGRIGPLFLTLALIGRGFARGFDYPAEKVTIG